MKESREEKMRCLIRMAGNLMEPYQYDEEKAWNRVRNRTVNKKRIRRLAGWMKYAAVLVIGTGVALGGFWMAKQHSLPESLDMASFVPDAQQVELILASGERVILSDSLRGKDLLYTGMTVSIDSVDHRLNYEHSEEEEGRKLAGYNLLKVPKGGEYALVLPDGTQVWLNSESSLRFPVSFQVGKREVFLEGEAFFKVAPDEQAPFHVYAGGRDVCVLGTSFNVSAYENDACFQSTLVTGKVKISGGKEEVVLLPSEQYTENQLTGKTEVERVDTRLYTSWLEGKIRFKGERLEDIVKKLNRWFDFEIFYANEEVKDMRFRGVINKYDSFDTALKHLEQTTNICFTIQGRTVTVRKIYNN